MLHIEERDLEDADQVVSWFESSRTPFPSPMAVMAGHFILAYDEQEDRLVPLIAEDLEPGRLHDLARDRVGQFPSRSFALGLDLVAALPDSEAKVALLVNDHKLKDVTFHPFGRHQINNSDHLSSLRREFYRRMGIQLPKHYRQILRAHKSKHDVIYEHRRAGRAGLGDITPPRSSYYSEQQLRNRFDNNSKHRHRKRPGFEYTPGTKDSMYRLVYRPSFDGQPRCMTEFGTCGCLGEVVEFIERLNSAHRVQSLILIAPDECVGPVRDAAVVCVDGLRVAKSIAVVSGLGGESEFPNAQTAGSWVPRPSVFAVWEA